MRKPRRRRFRRRARERDSSSRSPRSHHHSRSLFVCVAIFLSLESNRLYILLYKANVCVIRPFFFVFFKKSRYTKTRVEQQKKKQNLQHKTKVNYRASTR